MIHTLYQGDCLEVLRSLDPGYSIDCCLTSPPYFSQCDYEVEGQYGLEVSLNLYLERQVKVFRAIHKLLPEGGVCWIVIADTTNNYSPVRAKGERRSPIIKMRRSLQEEYLEKEALSVPQKLVDALRADGWRHRETLIWDKGSSGAISNSDTAPRHHESVLQMFKWSGGGRPYLNCKPLPSSILRFRATSHPVHPCPFPKALAKHLLDHTQARTVIDPYMGTGTTLLAAGELGMHGTGIELNPEFYRLAEEGCDRLSKYKQLKLV